MPWCTNLISFISEDPLQLSSCPFAVISAALSYNKYGTLSLHTVAGHSTNKIQQSLVHCGGWGDLSRRAGQNGVAQTPLKKKELRECEHLRTPCPNRLQYTHFSTLITYTLELYTTKS